MSEESMIDKTAQCRAALGDDPTYRTQDEYAAAPFNAWLQVTDEQSIKGLHATLAWEPYVITASSGFTKVIGFKRQDGAGFTVPCEGGRWWVSWVHPMTPSMGWHHHALGTYTSATAAAMAFDTVYELERLAGNTDRCRGAT